MAYKSMNITTNASDPQPEMVTIQRWAGIDQLATPSQIDDNSFSDAKNIILDELGAIDKRWGFVKSLPVNLGSGNINGFTIFNGKLIISHNTSLYEFDLTELL